MADLLRDAPQAASNPGHALAQKPGYVSGGITIAPANTAIFAAVYVEKQGAPQLAGVCVP
jgi:hypothetical protein